MTGVGPLVLLVEDEQRMRKFLRGTLEAHDYRIVEAATGAEGLSLAASWNPELIVLDLGLPDLDGIEVTRRLRERCEAPIIVVSARGQEADKVQALDAGADDYLTKPFGSGELLARLRVALRHAERRAGDPVDPVVQIGELEIDVGRRVVKRRGEELHLTPTEYKLLTVLVRHRGRVITHGQLLEQVWGKGHVDQTHYLRVYMGQLRQKLEDDPARPKLLRTEPGVGYRMRDD